MTLGRICLLTCASLLLLAGIGTVVGAEIWYRFGDSTLDSPALARMFFQVLAMVPTAIGVVLLFIYLIRRPTRRQRRRRHPPEIRPPHGV